MILCELDAPEGDPGQSCVHLFAHILSTSFSSVSIFSVCCYSSLVYLSKWCLPLYLSVTILLCFIIYFIGVYKSTPKAQLPMQAGEI
jgi:hypothetical protein